MRLVVLQHDMEVIVDLSKYTVGDYHPGASLLKRALWYIAGATLVDSYLLPFSPAKSALLRLFGARMGRGVVIKPKVNIKYPWRLEVGDHTWLGEEVWIDNLADVRLGSNVCLSQGAYLLTGNHNYKDRNFTLITAGIVIEDGAWVGARAVVCPGVSVGRGAVVAVQSVLTTSAESGTIYRGNPARAIRRREIRV